MLTIQSDNGKQGYKVGGKKYRCPKVVLSQRPLRTVLQRLDSETRGILSSQRGAGVGGPATDIGAKKATTAAQSISSVESPTFRPKKSAFASSKWEAT